MLIVAPKKNTYNLIPTHEEEPKMVVRMLRWFCNNAFALLTTRDVEGLEHIPSRGPYILASNHLSYLDAPLLYGYFGDENVSGWTAAKYQRHPLFAPILHMGRGIFIRRGEVDRDAITAAVAWLRQGNVFGISPEGTRSKTGALINAKTGIAYLTDQTEAPIVPIAVTGTETMIKDLLCLRRPRLTVRVGEPFRLPHLQESERSEDLRRQTDEVMCRIAALLPPKYRGVYAEHPRLKELLSEIENSQFKTHAI